MLTPILQFGTSRFLQAHVDLFVSQAMALGQAIGGITVVQTTASVESAARVAALSKGGGYPVRICGLRGSVRIDETLHATAVQRALQAHRDWSAVRDLAADEATVIISNTGDTGFELDARDDASLLADARRVPYSYAAKLLVLLHERWRRGNPAPLSIYPCELVTRNGEVLLGLVEGLALAWGLAGDFQAFLRDSCVWVNSLVDRIVSAPLHPVGAVAEPYALWAVQRQSNLQLPCAHEAIVLADDITPHECLKLHLLNLGHTVLAEQWLLGVRAPDETVLDAMNQPASRSVLEAVWADEVLPVFAAHGWRAAAESYIEETRERLLNPFLEHRIADIAQNHTQKKFRRIAPVIAWAESLDLELPQTRLRAACAGCAANGT
jgi:tagaturonate reductase